MLIKRLNRLALPFVRTRAQCCRSRGACTVGARAFCVLQFFLKTATTFADELVTCGGQDDFVMISAPDGTKLHKLLQPPSASGATPKTPTTPNDNQVCAR